jgi:hypothetical protein
MSNFDGIAEADLIFAHVADLCEGRVYRDLPDDDALPRFSDGQVKPYAHITFSTPVATAKGRGVGGERTQPHIFQANIAVVSGGTVVTDRAAADMLNRLLGWSPNYNTTPLKTAGGTSYTTTDAGGAPSRRIKIARYGCRINMAPEF